MVIPEGMLKFDNDSAYVEVLSGDRDNRDYETASGALTSTLNLFNGFGDVSYNFV